jgi:succinoglycan biosynthesis transport protein ExoP
MIRDSEPEIHFLDYWRVLQKRRWVLYTTLAVVVTTAALGSLLVEPVYTANTRLLIEHNGPNVLPFQAVTVREHDYVLDYHATQHGLIKSKTVARTVIADLNLAEHPDYTVELPERVAEGLTPEDVTGAERIKVFQKNLSVHPIKQSRLVDVRFRSHDKVLAAQVVNRVVETYISLNTEARFSTSENAAFSLSRQIKTILEEIDSKEKQLQGYAREHDIVPLNESQDFLQQNFTDMSETLLHAQSTRIEKEARLASLREADPVTLPDVNESALVRTMEPKLAELQRNHAQLSEKYKNDWPEMIRLSREIEETTERLSQEKASAYKRLLSGARADHRSALKEEKALSIALDDLKEKSRQLNMKQIDYNNLKLEIEYRRDTLAALVRRQSETSTTANLVDRASSNIRIVDAAVVPTEPTSPKLLLNLIISLVVGSGLGIGLAFFFEYLDKSVKSPEEMQASTGVPTLGVVPVIQTEGGRLRLVRTSAGPPVLGGAELASQTNPKSKLAEAFREVRTALLVSRPGGPPRTIIITSSNPEEGKTSVSLNLGITLAQSGKKILLVDADMRKPRLHKILGAPMTPGLSTMLSESGLPEMTVQKTTIPGLFLLPSGPIPPNPADLLDSDKFRQVLAAMEASDFDHIIFDSPPTLAVADSAIIAGRMDALVMVVWAGSTGRDAVADSIRRLNLVNAPIVGSVLNRYQSGQHGYYGAYEGKLYYGESEDTPESPAADASG